MRQSNPDQIIIDDTLPEEPLHPHFAPGQKVRDIYGKVHVVVEQVGCAVFVDGGGWFHPTKVYAID